MSVDSSGNLYLADFDNNLIYSIQATGTTAGTLTPYADSATYSGNPKGITVTCNGLDAGVVYIADTNNGEVVKVSADGSTVSIYATITNSIIQSVTVDYTTKFVYATDIANDRIIQITGDNTYESYGNTPTPDYKNPYGIACDPLANDGSNTIVYVADTANNLIRRIAADGAVTNYGTSGGYTYSVPQNLAVDTTTHYVYVADSGNNRIVVITYDGSTSGGTCYTYGTITNPLSITIDSTSATIFVWAKDNEFISEGNKYPSGQPTRQPSSQPSLQVTFKY